MAAQLPRLKCQKCGRTLAEYQLSSGSIVRIKCRCGETATLQKA